MHKQKYLCVSHFIKYRNFIHMVCTQGQKFTKENTISARVGVSLIFFSFLKRK